MYRKLYTLIFLAALWACSSDDPVESIDADACFEAVTEAQQASPVTFNSACSRNVESYLWNFGDGTTSVEASPIHSYAHAGTFEVTLTVTAGNQTTDTHTSSIKITSVPTKSHFFGEITEDEIWEAGYIHFVIGDVTVSNATVTIQPGVIVRFKENASLNIGAAATLIAEGTAQLPILFTADAATPTPGYYEGITFGAGGSGLSSMAYCTVEYGGLDYATTSNGNIRIASTALAFENNTIRHTKGSGIYTSGDTYFTKFNNNSISDYETYALELTPNTVHSIGSNNSLGEKPVIIGGAFNIAAATWPKREFPYLISGLSIGSTAGSVLTLQPGVVMKMTSGRVLVGDTDWGTVKGTLIAVGTEAEPILFTSASATPAPVNWDGIYFRAGNQDSKMKYCILEYGGSWGYNYSDIGMLQVQFTSVDVSYCTFRHAKTCAVYLNDGSYFENFDYNTIDVGDAADGVNLPPNAVHTLGLHNTITAKREIVTSGYFTLESATWPKLAYPYHSEGISVGSNQNPAWLTLAPGVEIRFSVGGLYVGIGQYSNGTGGLTAIGTPEAPIVFTSANDPAAPGDWSKLEFNSGTLPGTIAQYVIVEYAGSTAGYGSVYVDETNEPSIMNCTIRNSETYGIVTEYSAPTLANNVFENNAMADHRDIQ
jgi:parallel beta-helix repeat protein